jgi:hypothetical protein
MDIFVRLLNANTGVTLEGYHPFRVVLDLKDRLKTIRRYSRTHKARKRRTKENARGYMEPFLPRIQTEITARQRRPQAVLFNILDLFRCRSGGGTRGSFAISDDGTGVGIMRDCLVYLYNRLFYPDTSCPVQPAHFTVILQAMLDQVQHDEYMGPALIGEQEEFLRWWRRSVARYDEAERQSLNPFPVVDQPQPLAPTEDDDEEK